MCFIQFQLSGMYNTSAYCHVCVSAGLQVLHSYMIIKCIDAFVVRDSTESGAGRATTTYSVMNLRAFTSCIIARPEANEVSKQQAQCTARAAGMPSFGYKSSTSSVFGCNMIHRY